MKLCTGFSLILLMVLLCAPMILCSPETTNVCEVDTFTLSGEAGELAGWVSADKKFLELYRVSKEEDNYFLSAKVKGKGIIIAKEFSYDLKEFPLLSWRWRVRKLPEGGDERYKCSGDSGAGIYVIFPSLFKPQRFKKRWGINIPVPDALKPECIKYVWSASLPKGTVTDSPYASKTKIVVLENGTTPLNQWVAEEVNVYEDYRRLFNKEPEEVKALGILTDADDTSSEASADYDDIFIKKPVPFHSRLLSEKPT